MSIAFECCRHVVPDGAEVQAHSCGQVAMDRKRQLERVDAENRQLRAENERLRAAISSAIADLEREVVLYTEIDGPIIHKQCKAWMASRLRAAQSESKGDST